MDGKIVINITASKAQNGSPRWDMELRAEDDQGAIPKYDPAQWGATPSEVIRYAEGILQMIALHFSDQPSPLRHRYGTPVEHKIKTLNGKPLRGFYNGQTIRDWGTGNIEVNYSEVTGYDYATEHGHYPPMMWIEGEYVFVAESGNGQ